MQVYHRVCLLTVGLSFRFALLCCYRFLQILPILRVRSLKIDGKNKIFINMVQNIMKLPLNPLKKYPNTYSDKDILATPT